MPKSKSLSYLVCPITGLSITFKDDYNSSQLVIHKHPLTATPKELYKLIRSKGSSSLPKSYIVAGILLRLTENRLISDQHDEPPYLRGQILSYLEQEKRFQLVKLFWAVYNSQASLRQTPFTISLSTLSSYKSYRPMIALIFAVANQEFTAEDQEYNKAKTTASWSKPTIRLSTPKIKQDPISARNRVHAQLTGLLRLIDSAETTQLSQYPHKEVSGIYATKSAQQRITELRPYILVYHNCSIAIRHQLATMLQAVYTLALRYSILDQDEPLAKSFTILIDLMLSFEADPIEVSLDEEW